MPVDSAQLYPIDDSLLAHGSVQIDPLHMGISSSRPTTQELARRFANLRQAAGLDVPTFAARARLDPSIVEELESGTRM